LRSEQYLYSLQVPPLAGDNPIDEFIHFTRTGHCELFASAMTLMMRSLGVPARVVKGYRGGEWNPDDGSYTVLSDMAHLWVELYFIGYGWIPFDPSPPADGSNLSTLASMNRAISMALLQSRMLWYQNVVGYQSPWGLDDLRRLQAQIVPELSML
jgi:protein-glutamine gamma-glutamyltransferase